MSEAGVWEPGWPLDAEEHAAQMAGLDALLAAGGRVLELGAGEGRVAGALTRSGRRVVTVERDGGCAAKLRGMGVEVREGDFLDEGFGLMEEGSGGVDAVVCVGHTFMLVHEVGAAVGLLRRVCAVLKRGGLFVIDDVPALFAELAEGHWQAGFSEDGRQMVWSGREAVFALREAEEADGGVWGFVEGDVRCRLWTLGELELVGMLSGFGKPRVHGDWNLVALERTD